MKKFTICMVSIMMAIPLFAKTYNLQEAISEVSKSFKKKLDGNVNTIAVMDIKTEYSELNDYICSEMTHEFVISFEKTAVTERNTYALEIIRKELNYQNSGEVSDSSIQSAGNSLGADCVVMGELMPVSKGWQLTVKAIQVESKRVLISWSGSIDKNDKNIQFQIKKAAGNVKKDTVKLIDPKHEEEDILFEGKKLKKVVSMYDSKLSYSDIVEVFIQRFGIEYVNEKTLIVSSNFALDTVEALKNRKGEYAWTVYATDDNAYTVLRTNSGLILLSRYYKDGQICGSETKYFDSDFSDFLFKAALNYKAAGKSFSYNELVAYNEVLLGFENSSYYDYYTEDYRPNLVDIAAMNFKTEGHGVSSKVFIEMCAKAGFDEGDYGSLLHRAVEMEMWEGGPELAKLLISLGVDLNKTDKYGYTPLMRAVENIEFSDDGSSQKCAKILIEAGADVNIKNDRGETVLMLAIEDGLSNSVIQMLVNNGANVNIKNDEGETILMLAIEDGLSNSVIQMLINNGADVNVINEHGFSVLMNAVLSDEPERFLPILIKAGADVNYDTDGLTALTIAERIENEVAIRILKQAGAK